MLPFSLFFFLTTFYSKLFHPLPVIFLCQIHTLLLSLSLCLSPCSLPPSLPLSFSRTLSPLHLTSNQSVLPLLSAFSLCSLSLFLPLYFSPFLSLPLSLPLSLSVSLVRVLLVTRLLYSSLSSCCTQARTHCQYSTPGKGQDTHSTPGKRQDTLHTG